MDRFLALPACHATASHIASVQAKLDTLNRVKRESWAQLLASASRLFAAGELNYRDLRDLFQEMKEHYGPGFTTVWNDNMPVQANRVPHLAIREQRQQVGNTTCWRGTFPFTSDQPAPLTGVAVVYVIYDAWVDPIYVGSTAYFRTRMLRHQDEKEGCTYWTAYGCEDREKAYQLEERLLKEHKPRLNKKAGR